MQTRLHWWQTRTFVAAMAALAIVPLLWPTIPPLVDLPGHMGRYRVQLAIGDHPWLGNWYDFRWQLIGNLGIDLLVVPLAKVFGLELAVKLIVLTIPPLTVSGLLWIAREVHGRIPATALFALPLAYSYPFQFGFVNFALSMALALNLFALAFGRPRHRADHRLVRLEAEVQLSRDGPPRPLDRLGHGVGDRPVPDPVQGRARRAHPIFAPARAVGAVPARGVRPAAADRLRLGLCRHAPRPFHARHRGDRAPPKARAVVPRRRHLRPCRAAGCSSRSGSAPPTCRAPSMRFMRSSWRWPGTSRSTAASTTGC